MSGLFCVFVCGVEHTYLLRVWLATGRMQFDNGQDWRNRIDEWGSEYRCVFGWVEGAMLQGGRNVRFGDRRASNVRLQHVSQTMGEMAVLA